MRLFLPAMVAGLAGLMLALLPAAPASANGSDSGAEAFGQHCASCHSLKPGKASAAGPNLHGVFGRAAAAGDFRFSSALKASGMVWDKQTLDRYLTAPMAAVPGTRMAMGVRDKDKRAAIIAYLAEPSKP